MPKTPKPHAARAYTVKAVADLAGVSVRTLHHYDEIGLLTPAGTTAAGYRQYSDADLERLQQVLFFKELGFELSAIKTILDRPGFDRRHALATHRELLLKKKRRLETLIRSVERTIDAYERGSEMDQQQMFEGFDEAQLQEWKEEAAERWGRERVEDSYRRWGRMSKEEQQALVQQGWEAEHALAAMMDLGPDHPDVQAQIAARRQAITDHFYECTLEIWRGLGEMYVADARFEARYEGVKPGLAAFLREAIRIYCDREEAQA